MKGLILTLAVLLLRLVYLPMRLLPVKDKLTIISRQSDRPSADIRLLTDYMKLRYPQIECRVLTRFIRPGIGGKLAYLPHMLTQMAAIASSRVVVLDGYCIVACVLPHKPQTRIIQMWHAVAGIKKFGYQTIGMPGGHSRTLAEVLRMHRNYDMVLCPSEETGRIFCEAFRVSPDRLRFMGLPRLDLIWDSEDAGAKLREEYRIPGDREILLYVPTFRKDKPTYLKELIRSVDPDRFVLVIRLHPLEKKPDPEELKAPEGLQIIIDSSRSTQEWIRACDRVITDYSALSVEASLTGKPLYFYVYDITSYEQSVGLNTDPRNEMPGATAITGLQLADLLARPYDYDELKRFRDKYITVDTDACTARLGDFIYGIIKEIPEKVPDASSDASGQGA